MRESRRKWLGAALAVTMIVGWLAASRAAPRHPGAPAEGVPLTLGVRALFQDARAMWDALASERAKPDDAELEEFQYIIDILEAQWLDLRNRHQETLVAFSNVKESMGEYRILESAADAVLDREVDFQRILWRDGQLRLVGINRGDSTEVDHMTDVLQAFAQAAEATLRQYLASLERKV